MHLTPLYLLNHTLVHMQTGNSHMALLTAPEGSDLEEFRRTRAFMITHDDDESECSGCSSSSTGRWDTLAVKPAKPERA